MFRIMYLATFCLVAALAAGQQSDQEPRLLDDARLAKAIEKGQNGFNTSYFFNADGYIVQIEDAFARVVAVTKMAKDKKGYFLTAEESANLKQSFKQDKMLAATGWVRITIRPDRKPIGPPSPPLKVTDLFVVPSTDSNTVLVLFPATGRKKIASQKGLAEIVKPAESSFFEVQMQGGAGKGIVALFEASQLPPSGFTIVVATKTGNKLTVVPQNISWRIGSSDIERTVWGKP